MVQTQIHLQLDAQAHSANSPQSSPQTSPETRFPTYPPKRARYRTWAERRETSKNRRLRKQRIRNMEFCLATTADASINGLPRVPDVLLCNAPYEDTAWQQTVHNGLSLIPEVPQNGLSLISEVPQNGLPLIPEVPQNGIYEETACQQTVTNEVDAYWDSVYRECHAAIAEERVACDWACDWAATPDNLANSQPLSLLLEPASINLVTHSRKAKRAYLNHYDAGNEPRGSMLQRQADDELCEEFMWAAATGRIVDLTGDDAETKPVSWSLQRQTDDELCEEFAWAAYTGRLIDLTGDDIVNLTGNDIIDLTGDD